MHAIFPSGLVRWIGSLLTVPRYVALVVVCGVTAGLAVTAGAVEHGGVRALLGDANGAFEWAYSRVSDAGHQQSTRVYADGSNRRIETVSLSPGGAVVGQTLTVVTAAGSRRFDVLTKQLSISDKPGTHLSTEITIHPFFLEQIARYPSLYLLPPYFVRVDPLKQGNMGHPWPEKVSVSEGVVEWIPDDVIISGVKNRRKCIHDRFPLQVGWTARFFANNGDDETFRVLSSFKVLKIDRVELFPEASMDVASAYQLVEYDEQSGEAVMSWTCTSTAWKWSDTHGPELFEVPLHLADEVRIVADRNADENPVNE